MWRLATTLELLASATCWLAGAPPWTWLHAAQARLVEVPSPVLSAVALFACLFAPTCLAYALATTPERRRRGLTLDEVARLHELAPWGSRRSGSPLARRLPPGLILAALVLVLAGVSLGPAAPPEDTEALEARRGLLLGAGGLSALLALLVTAWRTWRDRARGAAGPGA